MFSFLLYLLQKIFMLGYLQNSSFPKPLSEKEEAELIKKYTEDGDQDAKNKLIEHNLRLVAHIVKKYAQNPDESDDLLSIGTIGLIKGINTFVPGKSTKLSTYVAKCIHNEILMVLRAKKHSISEISLNEAIGGDNEGNEVTLMDILPDDKNEIAEDFEGRLRIKKMYSSLKSELTDRERIIIELRYGLKDGNEVPQRKIAKMLNISRSYVSRIEKKAVSKLRELMEQENA